MSDQRKTSIWNEPSPRDSNYDFQPDLTPEQSIASVQKDPARWLGDLRAARDQHLELQNKLDSFQGPEPPQVPKNPVSLRDEDPFAPRKTPKHPDPDLYDGDPKQLRSFLFKLKSKFFANTDWFDSEETALQYAMNRLTGTAMDQMLPLVELDDAPVKTVAQLYGSLEQAFGDPNRKVTAQKEIQKLRQANRPFHAYLAGFEALVPYTGFDEEDARFQLKQGLCSELKACLVPVDEDSLTFRQLKQTCQRMDNKHRELPSFKPSTKPTTSNNQNPPRASAPAAVHVSTNNGNTAMDLSAVIPCSPRHSSWSALP